MTINVQLDTAATMPTKAHDLDAGYDLYATSDCLISAKDGAVIDTGVHIEIPKHCVGYVQGRSGLNIKRSIICPTGTVDCGYTGSIKVKLYNLSNEDYYIHAGDRIAQLVIQPIAITELARVDSLDDTERGDGGFGSSGT